MMVRPPFYIIVFPLKRDITASFKIDFEKKSSFLITNCTRNIYLSNVGINTDMSCQVCWMGRLSSGRWPEAWCLLPQQASIFWFTPSCGRVGEVQCRQACCKILGNIQWWPMDLHEVKADLSLVCLQCCKSPISRVPFEFLFFEILFSPTDTGTTIDSELDLPPLQCSS